MTEWTAEEWESLDQRSPVRFGAPVLHKLSQKQRDADHQNYVDHATLVQQEFQYEPNDNS
jgi:hypothetical protein